VRGAIFNFGDQAIFFAFIEDGWGDLWQRLTSLGRFQPFLLQEFRPLFSLGLDESTIITGLFSVSAAKLILTLTFIWLGVRRLASSFAATCVCLLFLLLTENLFWLFAHIECSESAILALWAAWFYFYIRAGESDKAIWYVLAALAAGTALYIKEPAFFLFLPSSLLLLCMGFQQLTLKSKLYHFSILFQVVIFLGLYYWFGYRGTVNFYGVGSTLLSRWDITVFYCRANLLIIPATLVLIWRGLSLIRRREMPVAIADVLLLNGLAFVAAYVILRLVVGYYILPAAPAILVGLFLFLHARKNFLHRWLISRKSSARLLATGALVIISVMSLGFLWDQSKKNIFGGIQTMRLVRSYTQETIAALLPLKKAGYTFISYLPPKSHFSPDIFLWEVNRWIYGTGYNFLRFYSKDYDFIMQNVPTLEELDDWGLNNTGLNPAWLTFQDPHLVEHAFRMPGFKWLLLVAKNVPVGYCVDDLVIDKTYSRSTPHFYLYFSTPSPPQAED
jgi:hypothetical protein